jgi:opacity protein-like surface antigen
VAIVAALVLLAAPAHAEEGTLKLTAGTFQLGGDVGLTSIVDSTAGQTNAGFVFSFSPSAGYFVVDNLELLLALQLTIPFGDYYSGGYNFLLFPKRFGAEVGARYHFNLAPRVTAYAGLQVGVGYTWYENAFVRNSTDLSVTLPAGVLIAVHENVAIDAGLRLILNRFFDADVWRFTVPVGYLGVEAYF